jgi:hypothetical protein
MTRGWTSILAFSVLLAVVLATPAHAGNFALQGNWGDDFDFGVGGRLFFNLGDKNDGLGGVASFDYFFPESDVTYWEINGNVTYALPGSLQPYVGAGLNLARIEFLGVSDSDLGLNLLAGVRLSNRVFAEGRIEIEGGDQLVLTVGFIL